MRYLDPRTLEQLRSHIRPRLRIEDPDLSRNIRLLDDKDRLLLELTLVSGASRKQMAVALNVAPGNVSRRIRLLLRRLADPLVQSLTHPKCALPTKHRQVGVDYFLLGCSLRELA